MKLIVTNLTGRTRRRDAGETDVCALIPLLYSTNNAARRLGVSESTVWRLVAEKKLFPTYVRGRTMISEAELQRYVAESTVRRREKVAPIADKTLKETAENRVRESTQDHVADE